MRASSPGPASAIARLEDEAGCVNALPALMLQCGFRLLLLRQFHYENGPPAFAWIDQRIFRTPERFSRHGMFFGAAFRPELMAWLSERLGRPSIRESDKSHRNPSWPSVTWRAEDHFWADGAKTTEWFADAAFQEEASWLAFRERWRERLSARFDG